MMGSFAVYRDGHALVLLLSVAAVLAAVPAPAAGQSPAVTNFPVPSANAAPQGIAAGSDGSIWFTESVANKIGELTPVGSFNEFAIPTAGSTPRGIAVASDGSIWFTESVANKIGELIPSGTSAVYSFPTFKEYTIPTPAGAPYGITIGPDGNPWFTESAGNQIGTVRGGVVVEYPLPTPNSDPEGITTSASGTIWFAEAGTPHVGTISTAGTITQRSLPTINGFSAIATDAAGNVWLVPPSSSPVPGVLELAASGPYSAGETFLPQGSNPTAVAVGPDGAAWFAEGGTGQIARITYTGFGGITRQYDTGGSPRDIVAGPANTLWFTDPTTNAIGRIDLTAPSITSTSAVTLTAGKASNVTLTTSGFPTPTLSEAGSLPSGVTFTDIGNGTATISGTVPSADAGLTFPVTITADSGLSPSASQQLSILVAAPRTGSTGQTGSTGLTGPTAATRHGTATASRPRISRATVKVTVACRGTAGQTCSITAQLTARHKGRRGLMQVVAHQTIVLAAGRHRTLRLDASRVVRTARAHRTTALTLIVTQDDQGTRRTLRRQNIALART